MRKFLMVLSWRPPHGPWGLEPKPDVDSVMERFKYMSGNKTKLRENVPEKFTDKYDGEYAHMAHG